ncbi:MAG: alpha/beta hydrolase, partial [Flavobacterium sp.]
MKMILQAALILSYAFVSAQSKPFVLGNIEQIDSRELSEKRTINIYLPEGYQSGDSTKYPVIYLLDGSADEDFIHIAGLV